MPGRDEPVGLGAPGPERRELAGGGELGSGRDPELAASVNGLATTPAQAARLAAAAERPGVQQSDGDEGGEDEGGAGPARDRPG